jgi:hypothetical protein
MYFKNFRVKVDSKKEGFVSKEKRDVVALKIIGGVTHLLLSDDEGRLTWVDRKSVVFSDFGEHP